MSMLEQSVMDIDVLARTSVPISVAAAPVVPSAATAAAPSAIDDDEFFRDLPVGARGSTSFGARQAHDVQQSSTWQQQQQESPTAVPRSVSKSSEFERAGERSAPAVAPSEHVRSSENVSKDTSSDVLASTTPRAYSSYSFSSSSVVNDQGRHVASTRRRYEDSSGRLKAVHERAVGDKRVTTVWSRVSEHDTAGRHQTLCVGSTPQEFDALWRETLFGRIEDEATKKRIEERKDITADPAQNAGGVTTTIDAAAVSDRTNTQCCGDAKCDCTDCKAKQQCPPKCDCSVCCSTAQQEDKVERELRNVAP